jgi:hypothetical protein
MVSSTGDERFCFCLLFNGNSRTTPSLMRPAGIYGIVWIKRILGRPLLSSVHIYGAPFFRPGMFGRLCRFSDVYANVVGFHDTNGGGFSP